MSLRTSIPFAILSALVCGSTEAHADANAPHCALGQYTPVASQPYHISYSSDFGNYSIPYGARLYIPAQPGLTREWLARDLAQALGQPNAAGGACGLPVKSVQIDVESAGPGFWVLLKAKNEREGAELVRWASGIAPTLKNAQL